MLAASRFDYSRLREWKLGVYGFMIGADPAGYADDVLVRAGEAARLLAAKADEGEAGAYKHWLVTIAEQVVTASPSGGILGVGGDIVTEPERQFRDRLASVLND